MKTLFRGFASALMVVIMCVTALCSCNKGEEYDFKFEMPGRIYGELGSTQKISFVAHNISSLTVTTYPEGWSVDEVDMKNWTITVTAPDSFASDDNKIQENGLLKMTGFTTAGTAVYISSFLSLKNKVIDLRDVYSNSYVINDIDTRYVIDVTHIAESSQTITPTDVRLLWQTSNKSIDYCEYKKEDGTFSFFVGSEEVKDVNGSVVDVVLPQGNALVAAYDADDNIIWSWHLWLTEKSAESGAIATSAGVFMDRNLGAYSNSNGSNNTDEIFKSYGLFYQWGRKDPFVGPRDYKFSANSDHLLYTAGGGYTNHKYLDAEDEVESKYAVGTLEFAIANPLAFVLGSEENEYDWIYSSHNNTLWNSESKSIYDPCPRGWRVPKAGTYTSFDIAEAEDLADLKDVRGAYGWNLVDKNTGVSVFMHGAGRRSYQTGVLTNMNNYGYDNVPMPWIGYYWTAGVSGAQAESMFFDLNTTRAVNNRYDGAHKMYRANAMQVRCVRE